MTHPFISAFKGEVAGLTAALLWAVATVVYSRLGKHLSPVVLNLAKGAIAIAFILLTFLLQGSVESGLGATSTGLLLLSGAIGIGFGDTAYFAAINRLGPRRALLMEALAPPLAALLALVFLNEQLAPVAWVGMGLTLIGIIWVLTERVPAANFSGQQSTAQTAWGIGLGMLAALGQASGAVLSRAALAGTVGNPLWSTLLRLTAGGLVLLLGLGFQQRVDYPSAKLAPQLQLLRSVKLWAIVAVSAFFGTYLAIWLQQIALKHSPAGIAQTLTATSPLFVLPIVMVLGERVSLRAIAGVLIALSGIRLLFG